MIFETVHDIDNKHGQVTKRATSRTQVGERLVTWCVDDEETWQFEIKRLASSHDIDVMLQIFTWEVCCTNLLSDTASFVSLHVGLSKFVENLGLTGIYVTHDTNDWASKLLLLCSFVTLLLCLSLFKCGLLSCSSSFSIFFASKVVESRASVVTFLLASSSLAFFASFTCFL